MPSYLRPRHISGALILWAAFAPLPVHAAEEETQAWLTGSVMIKASDADTVTIDASQRFRRAQSADEQQTARFLIDHKVAKGVQVGGGIAYFYSGPEQELRLFQQATLARGNWIARTRIEQRFFDTAKQAGWRLRQRVQGALPIDRTGKWALIGAVEVMFHLNSARPSDKTGLAVMRHQVGLRLPVGEAVDLQLLYMRQQTFRERRPDAVAHIPWATFIWKI